MKLFVFLFILSIFVLSLCGIDVSGNQSGEWVTENNPYNVLGDITIPENDSLVVNAGVEVFFAGNFSINALGNIVAIGTISDSIFFTSNFAWNEIRLENENRKSNFYHCHFSDAENAISSINSPVTISNCFFTDNTKAINIFGVGNNEPAEIILTNSTITRCQQNGVFIVENSNTTIDSCDISFCAMSNDPRGAIQISNQSANGECNPTITYNHIHDNIWQGITAFDITGQGNISLNCENNIIERNLSGIYLLYARGHFNSNIIRDNFIAGNANSGAGIMIGGDISSTGMPAIFTYNIVTGNFVGFYLVNDGSADLGCIIDYCSDNDGFNEIYANIDETGTTYSVYNASSNGFWAQNNIWDSTDYDIISQTIIDGNDNPSYGIVEFDPIYEESNTDEDIIIPNGNVKIYPNPYIFQTAKSSLKITFDNISAKNFAIYNLKGQLIQKYNLIPNKKTYEINLSKKFSSGIYFVRVEGDKSIFKKFAIIK